MCSPARALALPQALPCCWLAGSCCDVLLPTPGSHAPQPRPQRRAGWRSWPRRTMRFLPGAGICGPRVALAVALTAGAGATLGAGGGSSITYTPVVCIHAAQHGMQTRQLLLSVANAPTHARVHTSASHAERVARACTHLAAAPWARRVARPRQQRPPSARLPASPLPRTPSVAASWRPAALPRAALPPAALLRLLVAPLR